MGKVFLLTWEVNLLLPGFRLSAVYSRIYCNRWPSSPAWHPSTTVQYGSMTCYRFPSSCIIYLYSDCCRRTCCYVFVTFWRLIPLLSMQSCWGLAGSARAACSCGCCCCWCGWCCCWRCCTIGTIAVQKTAVFYAIVSLIYKDCCELRCNKCCRFLCCC